jgi:hypothetical protein
MSAGITLAQAHAQLALWLAADAKLATSQEYEIEDGGTRRRLKRTDAAVVTEKIAYWQRQVQLLTPPAAGGRRRTRYVVFE